MTERFEQLVVRCKGQERVARTVCALGATNLDVPIVKSTTLENMVRASANALDYGLIDTAALSDLALQESDPEVATSALGELSQRGGVDARTAAIAILQKPTWDSHLTAYALTVLYARDPDAGFELMRKFAATAREKTIIEALIKNVLSDRERFEVGAGRMFAGALARRIAIEQLELEADDLAQFNALYADTQ